MQLTQRQVLPGSSQLASNVSTLRRNGMNTQRTGRGKLNHNFHMPSIVYFKAHFPVHCPL
jgi:hypothetical protein